MTAREVSAVRHAVGRLVDAVVLADVSDDEWGATTDVYADFHREMGERAGARAALAALGAPDPQQAAETALFQTVGEVVSAEMTAAVAVIRLLAATIAERHGASLAQVLAEAVAPLTKDATDG